MPPWNGNIKELLSEEQLKAIEESLAGVPEGLCVDKRGIKLNRYPGQLSDLQREGTAYKIIASERPVTEPGMVLISDTPIPNIERALLVIRTDANYQQRLEGHVLASHPGKRPEDQSTPTAFHYGVFEPTGKPASST
ncbi:MAG TPA: hypothetical protein VK855_04905 [Thioalkalivibrio sp.]|jgi:hypothetical protein|nr:hypothetical protein [Thioalkalivibrio sp.]